MDNMLRIVLILFVLYMLYSFVCSNDYEHMENSNNVVLPLNRKILGIPMGEDILRESTIRSIVPGAYIEDGYILQELTNDCDVIGTSDDERRTLGNILDKDYNKIDGKEQKNRALMAYITSYVVESFNTECSVPKNPEHKYSRINGGLKNLFGEDIDNMKINLERNADGKVNVIVTYIIYEYNSDKTMVIKKCSELADVTQEQQKLFTDTFNLVLMDIYNTIMDGYNEYRKMPAPQKGTNQPPQDDGVTLKKMYDCSIIKTLMDKLTTLTDEFNSNITLFSPEDRKYIYEQFVLVGSGERERFAAQENKREQCNALKAPQSPVDKLELFTQLDDINEKAEVLPFILNSYGYEVKNSYSDNQ